MPALRHLRQRQDGWEARLTDLIAREQAKPFVWGGHDCATLAVAAVRAMTGDDISAGLPPWFSAASAARALRFAGAASAEAFFSACLPAIPPAEARRGDLVYAAGPIEPLTCPAVLTGMEAQSRTEAGWIVFPRALVVRAFRVG